MNEGNKAHETKILEMKQQHELNTKESEKIMEEIKQENEKRKEAHEIKLKEIESADKNNENEYQKEKIKLETESQKILNEEEHKYQLKLTELNNKNAYNLEKLRIKHGGEDKNLEMTKDIISKVDRLGADEAIKLLNSINNIPQQNSIQLAS